MFHGHHTWCFCWPNLHFTIELANQKVAKPLRRLKIDTPNGLFMFISLKHSRTLSISEHTYIYIYMVGGISHSALSRHHFSTGWPEPFFHVWMNRFDRSNPQIVMWLKHDLITLLNTSIFVGDKSMVSSAFCWIFDYLL